MAKAKIKLYFKNTIHNRFVTELTIHDVGKSGRYPDGVKYGLICKDLQTDHYVLFDNHHPKGPHIHINDQEFEYEYVNDNQLIEDFKTYVLTHLGVIL